MSASWQAANPEYRSPLLRVLDPLQLQDKPVPERRWIVPHWIPHGQTTMLSGDGGIGKTIAAMQLATACVAGRPWLGQVAMHCKAIVVLCEDDEDEIHRRQHAINQHLGIDFGDLMASFEGLPDTVQHAARLALAEPERRIELLQSLTDSEHEQLAQWLSGLTEEEHKAVEKALGLL